MGIFFGSYLGSILGVLGVFLVTKIDQREREKERSDALFLNNISIYRKILSILKPHPLSNNQLSSVEEGITEIKNKNEWNTIDSFTRKKLNKIQGKLYCTNEDVGLVDVVRNFIQDNLSEELEVTMSINDEEFGGTIEYKEIPEEELNSLTVIIMNNLKIDLVYEENVHLKSSKDDIEKAIKNNTYTQRYSNEEIANIYKKASEIGYSEEWKEYLRKSSMVFNEISRLKKDISVRIEKVFTY